MQPPVYPQGLSTKTNKWPSSIVHRDFSCESIKNPDESPINILVTSRKVMQDCFKQQIKTSFPKIWDALQKKTTECSEFPVSQISYININNYLKLNSETEKKMFWCQQYILKMLVHRQQSVHKVIFRMLFCTLVWRLKIYSEFGNLICFVHGQFFGGTNKA